MNLHEYLDCWTEFDWRKANCAHFAGQWAGVDLSDIAMPSGPHDLRATLRALNAATISDAVSQRLGPPLAPSEAQVGDIVLSRQTLGICNGRLFAAPKDGQGIVFVPMNQAEAAWRI